jgi:Fuc2NAc and GlcNAc transferase
VRFAAHLIAASVFAVLIGGLPELHIGSFVIEWAFTGVVFIILGVVWSVNLFNFMDGIDAIASVEAIFVFVTGGTMLWLAGGQEEGMLLLMLTLCVAGFSIWNLPPAKIFMGDSGSGFLGFLIAAFAVIGERRYGVPLLLWVIIYGTFWFDATVTLVRRMINGEKWSEPHRSHAYQRLHQLGWSHGRVVIAVACLNAVLSTLALTAYLYPPFLFYAFFLALFTLTFLYTMIERIQPMTRST